MKLSRVVLLPLVLLPLVVGVASALADDKPANNLVTVKIFSKHNNDNMYQLCQFGVCDTLKTWGFAVESQVPTSWDPKLKEKGVTLAPEKKDEAKKDEAKKDEAKKDEAKKDEKKASNAAFTIEGTLEFLPHKIPFYNHGIADVICFNAKLDVVVKDAKGNVVKKIAWQNLNGANKDAGEANVLMDAEKIATRLLMHDLFQVKEIADQIPQSRKEEFKKFMAEEETYHKENFDPAENHKVGDDKK